MKYGSQAMRLYALVEAGDPEAIDVYLCEQSLRAQVLGRRTGGETPARRPLLPA